MRITILGSSAFKEKKVALKKELIEMGHDAVIHPHYEDFVQGKRQEIWSLVENGEHAKAKIENDYIRWYYNAIVSSDAVLVVNLEKNGKENYIGGNVLMELGFAYVNNKKIFMYNPYPKKEECGYLDEIEAVQPIIINGDLSKIK
ncbi:MAG: hypothetical protein Athens071425_330 [Parcubacteria group bacterium Athens0714_25]|nr:MAG: hypothetical protein Athens071425_330 [Parcubacteria group bacterium Athens0714_25]